MLLALLSLAPVPVYDTVIRGGEVLDGTGRPAYRADIAIRGGKIAQIGTIKGKGRREIDARGMTACPGFVDVHTHAENVVLRPAAENFVRQGVTTVVVGNCGGSAPDTAAFLAGLDVKPAALNVATLVGHNTLRSAAMGGSFDRAPTPEERRKMREDVDRAMRAGALGLSTGLEYLPGTFAKTEEIAELARIAKRYNGIYTTHMRSEGLRIVEALQETFSVARAAKIPAHVSHLKLDSRAVWGQSKKVLGLLASARRQGLDLTQDVYAYTAFSTGLGNLLPAWAREGGRERFKERLADPEQRAKIEKEALDELRAGGFPDYGHVALASHPSDPTQVGQRLTGTPEVGLKRVLDIEAAGGASGVYHAMNEADLLAFLKNSRTMVASDGSVQTPGTGQPHPRSYGNAPRLLARYVRSQSVLLLPEAVRRLTSLPATRFRIANRGLLRLGAWADVVIFDPGRVADAATYPKPHAYARGIPYVLVNGVPVVAQGRTTNRRPGRALRRGRP